MCGRYTNSTRIGVLTQLFDAPFPEIRPRYNVAPTQDVPVVRLDPDKGTRHASLVRWGLVPAWAKDEGIGNKLINARAETLAEKPSFRQAF